jgi:hypothetical protein
MTTNTINIPTTPAEKLEVLQKTRDLLANDGWTKNAWVAFIDGTEKFCLYGAIEHSMGAPLVDDLKHEMETLQDRYNEFNMGDPAEGFLKDSRDYVEAFEGAGYDHHVDQCSLTTTMFNAAAEAMPNNDFIKKVVHEMNLTDKQILEKKHPWDLLSDKEYLELFHSSIMNRMRSALQSINDTRDIDEVLAVVDGAIEKLRAEVAAS